MIEFGFNKSYLMKDGKPWFPIMGEMHYSRYDRNLWEESLYKIKAGGIDIVSSYTIWIHHEEIEGEYDFNLNKDLRYFVSLCKKCSLYLFLRIGPWCHGEVRNGGFPDWILKKDFIPRTNDHRYFDVVKKLYDRIFKEVRGFLLKDGGPIIGIQIENEYGHCGGLSGDEGEKHMETLTKIAKEAGFDIPFYTATGWGGAVCGGLLPVMGGYCEAPWDQRITEIEPSGNYIFTYERNDHNIGSDHGLSYGLTFDINKFPYLTAELGGGLQVTHHRRPIAKASDIGAMSLVKLGSGVNLLGYYMYHGGTNPIGELSTLQESRETGLSDLPILSYDFRAPIREYGQISDTFKEIKLLTMFLNDFGEDLCKMPAYIPKENPLFSNNTLDIRSSVRHDGKNGYIFINNYQRKLKMKDHKDVSLKINLPDETIEFPKFDIKDKDYFFFPFNMEIENEVFIKNVLATPLCIINKYLYFFYGNPCEFNIDGSLNKSKLLLLSREDALNSWKISSKDIEHLIISENPIIETDKEIIILATKDVILKVYPRFKITPYGFKLIKSNDDYGLYKKDIPKKYAKAFIEPINIFEYEISFKDLNPNVNNLFLQIDYIGDSGKLYIDDKFAADNFYTGEKWEIELKRFNLPDKIKLVITPLNKDDKIYLENFPEIEENFISKLNSVDLIEQHKMVIF